MGRIRTFHTDGRRDYTQEGIYPECRPYLPTYPTCPKYVPTMPATWKPCRMWTHGWGFFRKDLKEKGLDDNTIIFFFSDHGGCVPRGKGYLYESGLEVPLIAYFPPKWQHLAGEKASGKDYSLVNFTDLGPTVLKSLGKA